MTPHSLMTYVHEIWETSHIIDTAAAAEAIMERLRKDGDELWQNVCNHLGILGEIKPESTPGGGVQFTSEVILDAVFRAIIQQEYARSISAEDRLIWGAGISPLTADCLVALMDCTTMADEAADELMEALTHEDFSVLCRQVRERGLTDPYEAAGAMLDLMPALNEMLVLPHVPDRNPCGHHPRTHVMAALAECYKDCLPEKQEGLGGPNSHGRTHAPDHQPADQPRAGRLPPPA